MIKVTAPHRLDIGGTWDLKPFTLLYSQEMPSTVTISISLYIHVEAKFYKNGYIHISDPNGTTSYKSTEPDFSGRFGLISAVLSYLNINNIDLNYSYDSPSFSGIGGSSIAVLATVAAVSALYNKIISPCDMIGITHTIENGLRYSFAGLQDQASAVYGGVNLWNWGRDGQYRREELIKYTDYKDFNNRLVIAYTGQYHHSEDVNSIQIESILDGSRRDEWIRINQITRHFATAIRNQKWHHSIDLLNEETDLRSEIAPIRLTPLAKQLRDLADRSGFAAAGSGNGGFVWCLCESKDSADNVKSKWSAILDDIPNAGIYDVEIARDGLCYQRV